MNRVQTAQMQGVFFKMAYHYWPVIQNGTNIYTLDLKPWICIHIQKRKHSDYVSKTNMVVFNKRECVSNEKEDVFDMRKSLPTKFEVEQVNCAHGLWYLIDTSISIVWTRPTYSAHASFHPSPSWYPCVQKLHFPSNHHLSGDKWFQNHLSSILFSSSYLSDAAASSYSGCNNQQKEKHLFWCHLALWYILCNVYANS